MILYTTMPLEEVLKNGEGEKANYIRIPYSRGAIEVQLISASTAKVVRLFSSSLDDYLHPSLQPGTEIRLRWSTD